MVIRILQKRGTHTTNQSLGESVENVKGGHITGVVGFGSRHSWGGGLFPALSGSEIRELTSKANRPVKRMTLSLQKKEEEDPISRVFFGSDALFQTARTTALMERGRKQSERDCFVPLRRNPEEEGSLVLKVGQSGHWRNSTYTAL